MTEKIKVNHFCPLGSKCEEIKDNEIQRCHWYIRLNGEDAMGKKTEDWGCAITVQVILQLESIQTTRGTQAAVESFRNTAAVNSQLIAKAIENAEVKVEEPRLIEEENGS